MNDFAAGVTGWFFIGAASMLWLGWTLLPVHIDPFFKAKDFGDVHARFRLWIWLYRIHLFGYVVTVMAFVALATLVSGSASRILVWPAAAVSGAGLIVSALAAVFYYHFGAWGAIDVKDKTAEQIQTFVDSLQVGTEYVTCLVRFGRVFFGLGQVVLAFGLLQIEIVPLWLVLSGGILGIAGMAVTMKFPDNLEFYKPLFHLNTVWLVAMGIVILYSGANLGG